MRHTYCAARLRPLDAGAPVSIYTVARELGHQSDEMVDAWPRARGSRPSLT